MRVIHLSLILLVIVSGCATVKTNKAEETRNLNIKPITTMLWENTVKEMQDKERRIQEEKMKIEKQKKLEEKKRLEKLKSIPVMSKVEDNADYKIYTLTAYTNGYESTQKRKGENGYGITASGKHTVEGLTIAADPRVLRMGTRVFIEGLGEREVQDVGGAIKGFKIDVFFEDLDEAIEFGRQNRKVWIIENQKKAR